MPAALKIASSPEEPLSPARESLAEAIEQLAAASAALDRAEQPVQRLQAPMNDLSRLDRQLSEFDQQLSAEVGKWIGAGSIGERPTLPAAATGIRQRRDALAADAAAASLALPGALVRRSETSEAARRAGRRRDEALAIVAGEAAQEMLPKLASALSEFLRLEGVLIGLRLEMLAAANRPDATTLLLTHAAAISDVIAQVKRDTAVPTDREPGRRLLDKLARDPGANL
jgi:hypothetical protein